MISDEKTLRVAQAALLLIQNNWGQRIPLYQDDENTKYWLSSQEAYDMFLDDKRFKNLRVDALGALVIAAEIMLRKDENHYTYIRRVRGISEAIIHERTGYWIDLTFYNDMRHGDSKVISSLFEEVVRRIMKGTAKTAMMIHEENKQKGHKGYAFLRQLERVKEDD